MTSGIFGLFELSFAVGYFLPALIFVVTSLLLWNSFGKLPQAISFNLSTEFGFLYASTITVLISWLCGIFLVAINSDIIRAMEGYGRLNPAKLFENLELRYFDKIRKKYDELDKEKEDASAFALTLAQRFPHNRSAILPTSFGNIIRSFETYSKAMYGFDAIPGWERIYFLIPKDNRQIINSSKSILDFWVNIWVLCIVFIIEYFWVAFISDECSQVWHYNLSEECINIYFIIIVVSLLFIARSRAKNAAFRWGGLIKAAIDIYLPDLLKKLEFRKPQSREEEFQMWEDYNVAIIYRERDYLPEKDYGEENSEKQDEDNPKVDDQPEGNQ